MLEIIQNGSDQVAPFIRMLVAGHESASMARFYLTAPNVLVASSGAPQVPLAASGAKSVTVRGEEDLFALKQALVGTAEEREQRLGFQVDTLVIDSLDEFQRLMLVKRLEKERRSETVSEDWSWISNRLNRIFAGITELDLNIIVISHLANVHESTAIKPNIQGAFVTQIHKFLDYALLLDAYEYVNESPEVVVNSTTEDELELEIADPREAGRTLVTVPTPNAPWVHDDTGTLDRFMELTFIDDFATIVERRASLILPESDVIIIEDEVAEELEEEIETGVEQVEPKPEPKPVPGMSSHEAIKAKLLGKS